MNSVQIPLLEPDTVWEPPERFPEFHSADIISIDTETCDPNLDDRGPGWVRNDGFLVGVSVAIQTGKHVEKCYLPIAHEGGGNLDSSIVLRYLTKLCKTDTTKIFHNSAYDLGWLSTVDIDVNGDLFDTMYGAALLDELRMTYNLNDVARDFIGDSKDELLLREAGAAWGFHTNKALKKNLWRLPARHVGPYAEQDAAVLIPLYLEELRRIKEEGLEEVTKLEMDLIRMTQAMRTKGVRVDFDKAEQNKSLLLTKRSDELHEIYRKFDVKVDVWAAESLAKAFDKHGLGYPRTPKTSAPSFTKEFLEGHTHELPNMIRHIRKIDKTISTFMVGMVEDHAYKGRIHPEFHQLKSEEGGTVSGRYSCSNPNLQQATGRDPEFSPLVRGLFLPEDGEVWGALDYSSQEPRLTIHYAGITHQTGSEEAVRRYNEDPSTDYHQMVADLAGISRKDAKEINLGLTYGMGEPKLCHKLGLPTEWIVKEEGTWVKVDPQTYVGEMVPFEVAGPEGKKVIKDYHAGSPFIKGIMDKCSNLAGERGYIKTILGRRCRFDWWEPTNKIHRIVPIRGREAAEQAFEQRGWGKGARRAYTHKALNRLIQGSAADQTKKAMLEMYKEGIIPLNQMHDELDISCSEEKMWRRCAEIMRDVVPLIVPVLVDCEFGINWGDARHPWEEMTL